MAVSSSLRKLSAAALVISFSVTLGGCSYLPSWMQPGPSDENTSYPTKRDQKRKGNDGESDGGLFGDLSWSSRGDDSEPEVNQSSGGLLSSRSGAAMSGVPMTGPAVGLGVNAFLWRASLDTVSFMPLQSADPVGGVIITDWYADPQSPRERFKLTVYILDKELRADGVRVSAFRQTNNGMGWQDAAVNPDVAIKLENAILVRARQLKVASGG